MKEREVICWGVMTRPRHRLALLWKLLGMTQCRCMDTALGYWLCYIVLYFNWVVWWLWIYWLAFKVISEHGNIHDSFVLTWICYLLWIKLIDGFLLEYISLFIFCMIMWLDDGPIMSGNLLDPPRVQDVRLITSTWVGIC